jgi:hypothetical protein
VNPVGVAAVDHLNVPLKIGKVSGQHRWRNEWCHLD